MNMFKKSKATTVETYLVSIPEGHAEAFHFLHEFIQKTVRSLKPHFAYNMLGYGTMTYVNSKKQKLDWPIIGLANQKNSISVYICAMIKGKYIAEMYKAKLGKVSVGKSCIRVKKLEDLDLKVLAEVLKLAEKNPGYGTVEERRGEKAKQSNSAV